MATTSHLALTSVSRPRALRILSLDGGGVKGYSSLLTLKRILRTMISDNDLDNSPPLPCDVFDLIVGTSTGGLIAIMLGRLHMSIDECLSEYERTSAAVFGHPVSQSKLGKVFKKLSSGAFYDLGVLEREIQRLLREKGREPDERFLEESPRCKVMVCVTSTTTSKADVLRNYTSHHPTQENYDCSISEAACGTAAAPMFFKSKKLSIGGEQWCDGAMRNNNPINEALAEVTRETERHWRDRPIGCVISIGTGVVDTASISNSTGALIKSVIKIMTDSEGVADAFRKSSLGQQLQSRSQYFRFTVPQGMQTLKLDEWKELDKIKAVTVQYLSRSDVGDSVRLCARSLYDPDSTLPGANPIGGSVSTRQVTQCDDPCSSYVDRPMYLSALSEFFWDYSGSVNQSFVLWGIGGVGKTQLALKLAETMKDRVSILWVRADQRSNFYHDFGKVVDQLRSAEGTIAGRADPGISADSRGYGLDETRIFLEGVADEWLLILDNADDMDEFRASMEPYIPRRGRVLITTRDPRFQGHFTGSENGINIVPMDNDGSIELLKRLVPPKLWGTNPDAALHELVDLLGNLPLGIAQAAANIVDQQIFVNEYLVSYRNASDRLGELLEVPVRTRQARDPRNAAQSVNVTWQMSFERLESSSPLSIALLGYLSCFHWESVPRDLIRSLPIFLPLSDAGFLKVLSRLKHLSLLEEYVVDSQPRLRMHPLVHEYSWKRLGSVAENSEFLEPCVQILDNGFPWPSDDKDGVWQACSILVSHAFRVVQLSADSNLECGALVGLMQKLARYLDAFGLQDQACDISRRAVTMHQRVYPQDHYSYILLQLTVVDCLVNSDQYLEALEECEKLVKYLQTDTHRGDVRERAPGFDIKFQKYRILYSLRRYDEACSVIEEMENLLAETRQDNSSDSLWQGRGGFLKYEVAWALYSSGKLQASMRITEDVLTKSKNEEGVLLMPWRDYQGFLLLKGLILRELPHGGIRSKLEALEMLEEVCDQSLKKLGVGDMDTWIAVNSTLRMTDSIYNDIGGEIGPITLSRYGSLIIRTLKSCVSYDHKTQQPRTNTLMQLREKISAFLHGIDGLLAILFKSEGSSEIYISVVRDLDLMIAKTVEKLLLGRYKPGRDIFRPIIIGWELDASGRHLEAENHYHMGLNRLLEWQDMPNRPMVLSLLTQNQIQNEFSYFHYCIMQSIARQGRLDEAREYRTQFLDVLKTAETEKGTLDGVLERDRNDKILYDQAKLKLENGEEPWSGEWWSEHEEELGRAQRRYGYLVARTESPSDPSKSNTPDAADGASHADENTDDTEKRDEPVLDLEDMSTLEARMELLIARRTVAMRKRVWSPS